VGEWPQVRLGDLVEIAHGWPFKSELFSTELTGRPIVVAIGNFRYDGGFRFDETTTKEYRGLYPAGFDLLNRTGFRRDSGDWVSGGRVGRLA